MSVGEMTTIKGGSRVEYHPALPGHSKPFCPEFSVIHGFMSPCIEAECAIWDAARRRCSMNTNSNFNTEGLDD